MTRPGVCSKNSVLFLTPEAPALDAGGGGLRSASLLVYLRARYAVEVVSFNLPPHSGAAPARIWRNAMRLVRGVPPLLDRYSGCEAQLDPFMLHIRVGYPTRGEEVEITQRTTSILKPELAPLLGGPTIVRLQELLKNGRTPAAQGGTAVTIANGVPQLTTPATINRTPPNNRNEQPLFFDPDVATPYMHQMIVGVQREVWKDTLVEISYVGSRGRNQPCPVSASRPARTQ